MEVLGEVVAAEAVAETSAAAGVEPEPVEMEVVSLSDDKAMLSCRPKADSEYSFKKEDLKFGLATPYLVVPHSRSPAEEEEEWLEGIASSMRRAADVVSKFR